MTATPKSDVDYATVFFRKQGSSYASYKNKPLLVKFTVQQLQAVLQCAKSLLDQNTLSKLDSWFAEVRNCQNGTEKVSNYK